MSQIHHVIAVETQGKTTRDRGALLAITKKACDLFQLKTLFLFHVCPMLNISRPCFVFMAAMFIGQNGQRGEKVSLISSGLCLGLKALESKSMFGADMEKIWVLAKVREEFQLLTMNTGPQKMRGKKV